MVIYYYKQIKKKIDYEKLLNKKLYKWWYNLSEGNIIFIYKDRTRKVIKKYYENK